MTSFFDTLAGREEPDDGGATPQQPETTPEQPPDQQPEESATTPVRNEHDGTEGEQEARARFAMATKRKEKKKPAANDEEQAEGRLTIDVYHTDDEVVIKSTIAGVDADDLDVSITEDTVTIRGARDQEEKVEEGNYYYRELYWGSFSRSVILPVELNPDEAEATIKDGVLTVHIPKAARSKERTVSVKKK